MQRDQPPALRPAPAARAPGRPSRRRPRASPAPARRARSRPEARIDRLHVLGNGHIYVVTVARGSRRVLPMYRWRMSASGSSLASRALRRRRRPSSLVSGTVLACAAAGGRRRRSAPRRPAGAVPGELVVGFDASSHGVGATHGRQQGRREIDEPLESIDGASWSSAGTRESRESARERAERLRAVEFVEPNYVVRGQPRSRTTSPSTGSGVFTTRGQLGGTAGRGHQRGGGLGRDHRRRRHRRRHRHRHRLPAPRPGRQHLDEPGGPDRTASTTTATASSTTCTGSTSSPATRTR